LDDSVHLTVTRHEPRPLVFTNNYIVFAVSVLGLCPRWI